MEKRTLGKTGLEVAPLAFGGNVFGWTADEETSFKLLDAFTGEGFNLVDTADVYSRWIPGHKGGESETVIGNWIKKGNRDKIILATKVGFDMGEGKSLSKAYILKEAEASLKRLNTDHIDLYQTHGDIEDSSSQETLEAYSQLVKDGKVRYIGASNISAERLISSIKISKQENLPVYQTLQPEYNLVKREGFEAELQQVCLDHAISVISYFSLASGFLTGKYRSKADSSKSPRGGGMEKYLNEKGLGILNALDDISARYQTSQASVALAWLMVQPAVAAPIASATSLEQLKELTASVGLKLDQDALTQLDHASSWKSRTSDKKD